jgi:hypothetical protein
MVEFQVDDGTTLLLEVAKQEVGRKSSRDVERFGTVTSRPSRGTLNSRRRGSTQSRPGPAPRVPSLNGSTRSSQPSQLSRSSQQEDVVSPFYATDEECSDDDERAIVEKTEEPGLDSLRGSFGTVGTIIRARRRARALSEAQSRRRPSTTAPSEFSGRGVTALSPRASVSGAREQNVGESDLEKTDLRQQFFGNTASKRSTKMSAASQEPLITIPPSVLRKPSTSVGGMARSDEELLRSTLLSESPPSSLESRRPPSMHAHFHGSDTLSRSRTLPTVIPSMTEEKKDF